MTEEIVGVMFMILFRVSRCKLCQFFDPNNWCGFCLFETEVPE